MHPTLETLDHYYNSPLGRQHATLIAAKLNPWLNTATTTRVLGLGYVAPYLESARVVDGSACNPAIWAMPARMGAKPWPEKRTSGNISCLVDSTHLPFVDAVFDQIIIAHHIEFAAPERLGLRELWRVLAPAGMLVLIVPNRTSLLTLFDATPFGAGKSYSKRQLSQMLQSALLQPMEWQQALLWPFARDTKIAPLKQGLTRLARHMQLSFSGVHLVRAQKLDGLGFSKTSPAVSQIPVLNAQF